MSKLEELIKACDEMTEKYHKAANSASVYRSLAVELKEMLDARQAVVDHLAELENRDE